MSLRTLHFALLLIVPLFAPLHAAAAERVNTGWVVLGELRIELSRALALRAEGDHPEDLGNIEIYFSHAALDADALVESGYPEGAARDTVDAAGGGLAVLCITPQRELCGLLLHQAEPAVNERLGAHGELRLQAGGSERIAGSWSLADFDLFGTPLSGELRFNLPEPTKP
jgi:hypothetical protein